MINISNLNIGAEGVKNRVKVLQRELVKKGGKTSELVQLCGEIQFLAECVEILAGWAMSVESRIKK